MKNTKVERTVDSTITFVVHLDEDEFISRVYISINRLFSETEWNQKITKWLFKSLQSLR